MKLVCVCIHVHACLAADILGVFPLLIITAEAVTC